MIHRDLKPENLLYSNDRLKIADFGLCKEHKLTYNNHSSYVSTRWYRAPEVIFKQTNYDYKIDIFAIGCVLAELYRGDPLMPGTSESDMIYRLANLIGLPTSNDQKLFAKVSQVCSNSAMQCPSLD